MWRLFGHLLGRMLLCEKVLGSCEEIIIPKVVDVKQTVWTIQWKFSYGSADKIYFFTLKKVTPYSSWQLNKLLSSRLTHKIKFTDVEKCFQLWSTSWKSLSLILSQKKQPSRSSETSHQVEINQIARLFSRTSSNVILKSVN